MGLWVSGIGGGGGRSGAQLPSATWCRPGPACAALSMPSLLLTQLQHQDSRPPPRPCLLADASFPTHDKKAKPAPVRQW